jgi:hypothetical protein
MFCAESALSLGVPMAATEGVALLLMREREVWASALNWTGVPQGMEPSLGTNTPNDSLKQTNKVKPAVTCLTSCDSGTYLSDESVAAAMTFVVDHWVGGGSSYRGASLKLGRTFLYVLTSQDVNKKPEQLSQQISAATPYCALFFACSSPKLARHGSRDGGGDGDGGD